MRDLKIEISRKNFLGILLLTILLALWIISPFGIGKSLGLKLNFYNHFLNFSDQSKAMEAHFWHVAANTFRRNGYSVVDDSVGMLCGLPSVDIMVDDNLDMDTKTLNTKIKSRLSVHLTPVEQTTNYESKNVDSNFPNFDRADLFEEIISDDLEKHVDELASTRFVTPNYSWYWAIYALALSAIGGLIVLVGDEVKTRKVRDIVTLLLIAPLLVLILWRVGTLLLGLFLLTAAPRPS